jgi:RNA polymerase sigma-70 factor (ECF subfamily)
MDSAATSSFGLLERIRRGDRDAFTPLFEKYRPRVAVLVRYKMSPEMRGRVEVDDLLQETFLRAYRELDHFDYRGAGSFMHWLSRIAEHVIIDTARYQNRDRRRAEEQVPLRSESNPGGVEPVDSRTPSRLLARNERLEQLFRVLDELPEQYREIILLAKIQDLTTQEIAEKLGKSRAAAALLLHRALKQFRQIQQLGDSQ